MSARARGRFKPVEDSAESYTLSCRIEQRGPDHFVAVVTAVPGPDCPSDTKPESESRMQATREEAFMACAEIGFAMEARLLLRGARVLGWPPRGGGG